MDSFASYGHAVVAMALVGLMALVMGPLVGRKKSLAGLAPGAEPAADYSSAVYRWHRAYLNLTESLVGFVAVTLAAMLAGAAPFWVNLLAAVFLVARFAVVVIHVRGIGRADAGLRSLAFGTGLFACICLALFAIAGVFFSG